METNGEKSERKLSRRERKGAKSATLPPGAVLMAQPGEGIFTKIRRCLRLHSKGKYNFSHTNSIAGSDCESSSVGQRKSSDTLVNDNDDRKMSAKSSPQKASRRSRSDKEEVVLIRKDNKNITGIRFGSKCASEGGREEVLIITISESESSDCQETVAGASGVSSKNVNDDKDEVFDELDPDYESLDDIRRKVRSQSAHSGVIASQNKAINRIPLQVKIKTNSDLNGLDSGINSPFTDSPGSSRESQAHSVASSVLSNSAVFSDNTEHFRELGQSPAPVITATDVDHVGSLDISFLNHSNSILEEDDLYSNAKVLIRKKSQKQAQSDISLSFDEQRASGLFADQSKAMRNSLTPADLLIMMEADSSEPPVPPPLPARNYSEEDLSVQMENTNFSNKEAEADMKLSEVSTSKELNSSVSSETLCNGVGARPKIRNVVCVEEGPVVSVCCRLPECSSGNINSQIDLLFSSSQDIQTQFTNNIYEDIPAKVDVKQTNSKVPMVHENKFACGLTFIDEVSTSEGDCHPKKPDSGELPEDVMIVSASDSICGSDISGFHINSESTAGERIHTQTPLLASALEVTNMESSFLENSEESENSEAQTSGNDFDEDVEHDPPNAEFCSKSDSGEDILLHPSHSTSVSSSSSSQYMSASLPSSASSMSNSSTDTLNNMANSIPDPDDFEGKDLIPPVGPPIHMSYRQLQQHLDTRTRQEEPPPIPVHQPVLRRGGSANVVNRNVQSMDISSCRLVDHEGSQSVGASNARRHSSSAAASQAHRDFLESMKQLKDCGWYWGPLSYEEAESKLTDKRDGSFLVRDSSNENYILSLSFKSMGQVHHTRIEHHKGLFSFWSQPDSHGKAQICQFIEQTIENSKNGRFLYFLRPAGPGSPPLPIQLLYPVSRFCRVPSLQHMCRFLVLRCVRRDHIDHLPLPQKVKTYLLEKQYYVETLEED